MMRGLSLMGFVFLVLTLILSSGCALIEAGDDETITVEVGDSFILSLDSNPTTGYSWETQFDSSFLELAGTTFEPSSPAIGAGGIESFEFLALEGGDTEVTMVYKRGWEGDYLEIRVFSVRITEAEL